ncbi:uncharacterized protein LOC105929967 [Fundulus heteroclitus]|uniref:uncharacterized protein LOC105929967 n=1 Tax=Fundulus heteroclitus TaxID=8078 RepID=UPI00165B503D|nr:uncharacterized protein LOC105929967 [Fundulus heteroclitus]
MALGFFLCVAWISLLLDSNVVIKTQAADIRQNPSKLNLVDVTDFSDSLSLDAGEGELSDKISKVVNKEYKKSPAAQPLKLSSVDQILVGNQGVNVERLVNGASRQWESNVFEPITFPLKSGSHMVNQIQPKPVESTSGVYGSRKPVPPSFEATTEFQMKPKPAPSTHLAVSPPSFESWKPAPPSREGVGEQLTGSFYPDSTDAVSPGFAGTADNDLFSYQGSNMVEFPAGNVPTWMKPSQQYSPTIPKPSPSESWSSPEWFGQDNEIDNSIDFNLSPEAQVPAPFYESWVNFPYVGSWLPNSYFAPRGYQPDLSLYREPLAPVVGSLPPKVPEPSKPLPPRKSFILQSKNGYHRRRFLKSKTTYTPDYKVPKGKYGKSVKVSRGVVQKPSPQNQ